MPRHWLFKSEPGSYSFDDLVRDGTAEWDGVRNFQARNFMREMSQGDQVLFYHSSTSPLGVVGTAKVVREAYPDHTAWDPGSDHPDPRSTPDKPVWYMVDISPGQKFAEIVTVDEMRAAPELQNMIVVKKGNRLSITPVTPEEFAKVVEMGEAKSAR